MGISNGNQNTDASNQALSQASNQQTETFTQEQVDAIVKDRLAREREKYKDYSDLKAKAAEFDKQQDANKTELQKAQERGDALQKELTELKKQNEVREIREKVSKETGVPAELLTGSDEDTCREQAEGINKYAGVKKYPGVKETSRSTAKTSSATADNSEDDYRALAKQVFGGKE